jgi:hypothetical protein
VHAHIIPNNFLIGIDYLHECYQESFLYFRRAFDFTNAHYQFNQEAVESIFRAITQNNFFFDELIANKKGKYNSVEFRWRLERKLTYYIKITGTCSCEVRLFSASVRYIEPKEIFGTLVLEEHKIVIPPKKTKDYWTVDLG